MFIFLFLPSLGKTEMIKVDFLLQLGYETPEVFFDTWK